ncbi:MAG: 4Fe-4S binding protein [Halanaerobiales bacterium]|nr:4Fe-4S binding protein [Halanaerobiales bacterium]
MIARRIELIFKPQAVSKPITYYLVKKFELIPNILQARIFPEEEGQLIMDLKGETEQELQAGIKYLAEEGVEVRVLARSIIHNREKCTDCGACTGVCKTGALTLNRENWELVLADHKCLFCEMCLDACPFQALSLETG